MSNGDTKYESFSSRGSIDSLDPAHAPTVSRTTAERDYKPGDFSWKANVFYIFAELVLVVVLLVISTVIYKNKKTVAEGITLNIIQDCDAVFYILIEVLTVIVILFNYAVGQELQYPSYNTVLLNKIYYCFLFLIVMLIILYFVFNCIWLVKDNVSNTNFNFGTYILLVITSLTCLIPIFIIFLINPFTNTQQNETTISSLSIILITTANLIGGSLMIWDPNFMIDIIYNTTHFSQDVKDNEQLELYNLALIVSSFLTIGIIIPIMIILVKGNSAKYSFIFLVLFTILTVISSIYLLMNLSLFSKASSSVINMTQKFLLFGIICLLIGLVVIYGLYRENIYDQKIIDFAMIIIKAGICCIAVAQCLIGYYLYPLYETPTTSTSE